MSRTSTPGITRRGLLASAGGVALAGAAGAAFTAVTPGTAAAAPAAFVHPGMLNQFGELNRAKVRFRAGTDP